MAPKVTKERGESKDLKSKSPAEFFAEHQNIAGFDNPGKSLFTTIREFVENSLDAAETIDVLPDINISIEKISTETFNKLRGIVQRERKDQGLYTLDEVSIMSSDHPEEAGGEEKKAGKKAARGSAAGYQAYYRITCKDNGMGMAAEQIPQMLGVVLSSTKYGVKQSRGKFGLGAKMALVWSKKSTGLPIEIKSSQRKKNATMTYCSLDIDIHKNEPKVLKLEELPNTEGWRGTEISVVIGGSWTHYCSKVITYMRQLAVITPYAQINLEYADAPGSKKELCDQI